jgi:hypothetical protein
MTWSDGLAPEVVYGLIPRFVGLLYVLGFGALIFQHDHMAGSSVFSTVPPVVQRLRRDFPGLRRFFEFPTFLWLSSSELTLRIAPILGTLGGCLRDRGRPLWHLGVSRRLDPLGCLSRTGG